jgi:hypothetical protein
MTHVMFKNNKKFGREDCSRSLRGRRRRRPSRDAAYPPASAPMPKTISTHDDTTPTGPLTKKAARQRTERVPIPAGKRERAQSSPRQVRPRTPAEIANEQTAEQLALRIWAAMVGEKVLSGMSALMDELLQSHLLDDDDEEGDDEGWARRSP